MSTAKKFLKSVKDHRETKKPEKFSGVLEDYLNLLDKNPSLYALAHKRLYGAITTHGLTPMSEDSERYNKLFNGETVKIYNYFKEEFFGMERSLQKVMRFLQSGAMRGDSRHASTICEA